jgi:excisionase family DNA binding protein
MPKCSKLKLTELERFDHAITASEVASLLSVSKITIFKHARSGRIPSFRIGTLVRFNPQTLAKWLRTQETVVR